MRMIGSIPHDVDAERFSDYLVTQNIANMVEQSAAGANWDLWVENDDDLDRGKAELAAYLQNSGDPKYNAKSAAQQIRDERRQQQKKKRAQYIDVRTQGGITRQAAAPLTIILIVLSIVVTLGTNSIGIGAPREKMIDLVRFTPTDRNAFINFVAHNMRDEDQSITIIRYTLSYLKAGQIWRLISPIFIHYGAIHLLFNLFWIYDLGLMIETRRGTWRLLGIVMACALASNLGEFFWEIPMLPGFGGMSGVVYGLFGYVWMKQKFEPKLGLGIADQSVWIMIIWLVACMSGKLGNIANAAHVVGLIMGCAIAIIPVAYRRFQRRT